MLRTKKQRRDTLIELRKLLKNVLITMIFAHVVT